MKGDKSLGNIANTAKHGNFTCCLCMCEVCEQVCFSLVKANYDLQKPFCTVGNVSPPL